MTRRLCFFVLMIALASRCDEAAFASPSVFVGPRPAKWCGWFMRSRHGGGPRFNLAREWRSRGVPAVPQVGAIVVWPHHVGEITGRAGDGRWIVLSGNDGGRVRQRARSIAGAVIRWVRAP